MEKIGFAFLLIFILFQFAVGQSRKEFRDFSQKDVNYKHLENLLFVADEVLYLGEEKINIIGQAYTVSKYSLTTKVKVQTLCAIGGGEVYEEVPAEFEIFVAEDNDKNIHNSFVLKMYEIWSKKELFSGEYFFDFNSKANEYALTVMPDLLNVKGFYYIWVNGRVIKLAFKSFLKESGGWGILDSFTSENFRIKIANAEFKAFKYPLGPKREFLKLYKANFFKLSKKI